jgi:hypothetical protein
MLALRPFHLLCAAKYFLEEIVIGRPDTQNLPPSSRCRCTLRSFLYGLFFLYGSRRRRRVVAQF